MDKETAQKRLLKLPFLLAMVQYGFAVSYFLWGKLFREIGLDHGSDTLPEHAMVPGLTEKAPICAGNALASALLVGALSLCHDAYRDYRKKDKYGYESFDLTIFSLGFLLPFSFVINGFDIEESLLSLMFPFIGGTFDLTFIGFPSLAVYGVYEKCKGQDAENAGAPTPNARGEEGDQYNPGGGYVEMGPFENL